MRIGVLTFHRCINYGSYWQARCLVQAIAARGHDAVLLDHRSCAVTSAEWRYAFNPQAPERSSRADLRLYGAKLRRFAAAQADLPLSDPFPLDQPGLMPAVDLALIGSDEVFNLRHPWYGGKPLFWGAGLNAARVASYAASFGNHDADWGIPAHQAGLLRGLDAVSVRDANSLRLVREAAGLDAALVLDPVLLSPPHVSPPPAEGAGYVLVYGHHLPGWFADRVQAAARRRGLRTLSVGYRNDWADEQRLDAGPAEFAALVAGAAAVATTYFHGCCFALVNGRPLACAPSDYRWNKVRDLTALLGAERHLTFSDDDPARMDALLAEPASPAVADRLATLRAQSWSWLDKVLAA
ncbi:polysaccharide pyruvyl transferase family protein [Paracoccus luteus]|uniref:polysaccharide pyruvyl transferase family protein n=1 Tax=Paracoccus luteus TaxID=2508543 RepID=UPI00106F8BCC|nr:polysaccharide pyruvyl transferase family protein [Paracoccus luteus]